MWEMLKIGSRLIVSTWAFRAREQSLTILRSLIIYTINNLSVSLVNCDMIIWKQGHCKINFTILTYAYIL